jgi:hypothetical protein
LTRRTRRWNCPAGGFRPWPDFAPLSLWERKRPAAQQREGGERAAKRLFEGHDAAGVAPAGQENLAGRAAYAEILAATLKDSDEI